VKRKQRKRKKAGWATTEGWARIGFGSLKRIQIFKPRFWVLNQRVLNIFKPNFELDVKYRNSHKLFENFSSLEF
jgi:hypothetical protein